MTLSGVEGLSDTPAFLPRCLIACSERSRCGPASAWTVMMVAAGLGEGGEVGIGGRDHQMAVEHLVGAGGGSP